MKKLLFLLGLFAACRGFAADGVGIFQAGLQAFQANGANGLLNTWYNTKDDFEKIAVLRDRLTKVTQGLGSVVETQVFAPHNLGRHVQKLYGVIYFEKRPLWLRAEFYEINGRGGLLTLEWSLSPDEILPLTWAPSGT
jgi:hypothetical protein